MGTSVGYWQVLTVVRGRLDGAQRDAVLVVALGVAGERQAGDGERELVEVAEDDARHRVAAEQLHRAERRDAA